MAWASRNLVTTYSDVRSYIGRTGAVYHQQGGRYNNGCRFAVRVLDARVNFGRVELLVSPVEGDGCFWVSREGVEWA